MLMELMELRERPEFTLWHVKETYSEPELKESTLLLWIKEAVIQPAMPSQGTGHPARYSYANLIEIGTIWQLTRLGVNSHAFLKKFMRHDKEVSLIRLIQIRPHDFNCFIALPAPPVFWQKLTEEEARDYVELPPILLPRNELNKLENFFEKPPAGWILVDVGAIKRIVDQKLASLK